MSNFNFNMSVCGQLFYFKHILLDNRFKVTLKSHLLYYDHDIYGSEDNKELWMQGDRCQNSTL